MSIEEKIEIEKIKIELDRMEAAIRESIKVVCDPPGRRDYIEGYLHGRLNGILLAKKYALGIHIDFSKEV